MKLERATSGRANCLFCGATIARNELRIVGEVRGTAIVAHFTCAVERESPLAHDAVVSRDNADVLVEAAVLELGANAPQIARQVLATFAARGDRFEAPPPETVPGWDDKSSLLLGQLDSAIGDRELLAVLGDHLQAIGDPRGELIALDLANRPERDAQVRRNQLRARLAPALDTNAKSKWGIGFIRRLELPAHALVDAQELFEHPSCRLATELRLVGGDARLSLGAHSIPNAVHRLEIARAVIDGPLHGISRLARLHHLVIDDCTSTLGLAHPTLRHLSLRRYVELVPPTQLPGVTRLSLRAPLDVDFDEPLALSIANLGWLTQLTELDFEDGVLDEADIHILAKALGGRRLARLSMLRTHMPVRATQALQTLCDELVFPDGRILSAAYVEHVNKPEWGRGFVVRRYGDKLDVDFASGTKTFMADAPFLRPCDEPTSTTAPAPGTEPRPGT